MIYLKEALEIIKGIYEFYFEAIRKQIIVDIENNKQDLLLPDGRIGFTSEDDLLKYCDNIIAAAEDDTKPVAKSDKIADKYVGDAVGACYAISAKYNRNPQAVLLVAEVCGNAVLKKKVISTPELVEYFKQYCLYLFGLLARVTLRELGISSTKDFGDIVFELVAEGYFRATEDDKIEHFVDVFKFSDLDTAALDNIKRIPYEGSGYSTVAESGTEENS